MLLKGKSPSDVATVLGISPQTARRYQSLMAEGGLDALTHMSVGGRKPALSPEGREWIASALRGSPVAYGFDSDQWTEGRLRSLVENKFGLSFSRVYVRQIIIDLGFADRLKPRRDSSLESSTHELTSEILFWVAAALRHSPKAEGFASDRWTNERLRTAIEHRFGVRYSREHVWKIATDLGRSHLLSKARRVGK